MEKYHYSPTRRKLKHTYLRLQVYNERKYHIPTYELGLIIAYLTLMWT